MSKLVIAIGTSVLFDMREEEEKFEKGSVAEFRKHQLENRDVQLKPAKGMVFVQKVLYLKEKGMDVEVVLVSKQHATSGLRAVKNIVSLGLDISVGCFTDGKPISPYLEAHGVDLFLSRNKNDVIDSIANGIPAAQIYTGLEITTSELYLNDDVKLKIAFDGDSVLFSNEAELVYKQQGLAEFTSSEQDKKHIPLADGPFMKLLKKLSHPDVKEWTDISLVTARSIATLERAVITMENAGVTIGESYFMSGKEKTPVLKVIDPDIFFDDQKAHITKAVEGNVPSARVVDVDVDKAKG